ncbi:hypothetical protein ACFYVL_31650 [Streptomyces sp. NPDC004111]|uniref:hypothetical protein n=1 Tax=Streptomyces sp. NPDC004111 TaxID=3364690 RepID=UPI0036A4F49C
MKTKAPGRARKKKDRQGCAVVCRAHDDWLTEDERALLLEEFPTGLPAQVRLILDKDEREWNVSRLASLVNLMPLTVRLLLRGWRLPVGSGPRRAIRRWVVDLVCPGCIAFRQRERDEQQAAAGRRARRAQLRARHRALEAARWRQE